MHAATTEISKVIKGTPILTKTITELFFIWKELSPLLIQI